MGTEIERKFLVRSQSWRSSSSQPASLRQGYLAGGGVGLAEIRVRQSEQKSYLTIKSKGGLVRSEFEYEIPSEDAEFILNNLCGKAVITKRRYEVMHNGIVWSVDEFLDRHSGLYLAEVELSSPDQAIELPEWVGPEVTSDSNYRNATLALST